MASNAYSSTSSSRKSVSLADKYSSLFDNDWKRTQRSAIRTKLVDTRTYDPISSWDGKADNPYTSRLDSTALPFSSTRPLGLAGKAVIPLESTSTEDILGSGRPNSVLPLTTAQRDIGMVCSSDGSFSIPIVEEAKRSNKVVVIDNEITFSHGKLQNPTFKLVDVPKGLIYGGPNGDKKLMNPIQRREVQEFERRREKADAILSAQVHSRATAYKAQQNNIHSHLPSPEELEFKDALHRERRANLAKHTSAMSVNGNILVPESLDTAKVKLEKLYQSKGGTYHALSYEQTHNRLFYRVAEIMDRDRQQFLRNQELGGRRYNIVTHESIDIGSAKYIDRKEDKILSHPSQTSLEGPRNLQGSLRPY